ncbi:shikimate dehydrogenase family protein [Aspergillus mulundensis]|uniref:Shikimate dehydrogenase substrate binding N-terminal domain-containing protein n=1 Tax=Aspergillus mulundensis TaxID=1810919 RepID=A0A3D8RQR0_9EURO|nr:Uncharacterized protein DSM5745_06317 [Aspergillus mulundensis]RDW76325.1 Uncharacterized protein DSM5745_06317 [Aspergillus mulundensis]
MDQFKKLHIVGVGVTHSIAPAMHNYIAVTLSLPCTFHATECAALSDLLALARDPQTAGLVVTMQYKSAIMPHLDEADELATFIGACNNVYYSGNRLCGTNTDWRGIKGCLLQKGDGARRPSAGRPGTALVVGAGGASRAAVYALSQHLHCATIYVLNRDDDEVRALIRDAGKLPVVPEITPVRTLEQGRELQSKPPYYVVGIVPDLEPTTEAEKTVAAILELFLAQPGKGVLLDMCFNPRRTRIITLGERLGWATVEGTHEIGYQMEEQWRLWAGEKAAALDWEGACAVEGAPAGGGGESGDQRVDKSALHG